MNKVQYSKAKQISFSISVPGNGVSAVMYPAYPDAPRRIIFFGSRDCLDYQTILSTMEKLKKKYRFFCVISGKCRGADTLSEKAALKLGLPFCGFPANWDFYKVKGQKNPAGPIRNSHMLYFGQPDRGVCFHNDLKNSKGSKDMHDKLVKAGVPVKVYKYLTAED